MFLFPYIHVLQKIEHVFADMIICRKRTRLIQVPDTWKKEKIWLGWWGRGWVCGWVYLFACRNPV